MFISVIMSVYNDAAFLSQAIESVLWQTHQDFEFIIVNDGSTDTSLEIIKAYAKKDSRICVLTHENWGNPRSVNQALALAKGEWVARLDSDDRMRPNRLERQIAFIRRHPGVKVFSSKGYQMNDQGEVFFDQITPLSNVNSVQQYEQFRENQEIFYLLHPGTMMHRQTILDVGGYREIWPCEDIDLWSRVADKGHLILVQDECLMDYRVHKKSVTVKRWYDTILHIKWIKACTRARREHREEPSYEHFLQSLEQKSWFKKLLLWREINALYFHKMAGIDKFYKYHLLSSLKYGFVALLRPFDTFKRLVGVS